MTACRVCGGTSKPRLRRGGWVLLECVSCGMVFVDPAAVSGRGGRPVRDPSWPSEYYKETEAADRISFRERFEILERHFPVRRGRLLDIGSSTGTFLREAKARGWEPTGIEPDPRSVEHSRRQDPGIEVIPACFDGDFAEGHAARYDLISSSDVIEHTADPVAFLAAARRLLAPGGLVATVTPDFDSIVTKLFHIKPAEHVVYLRRGNIGPLYRKAGLEVVEVRNVGRRRNLAALPRSTTLSGRGPGRALKAVGGIVVALRLARAAELFLDLCREDLMIVGRAAE